MRLAAVGFVASLVLLLIGFASSFLVGAVAFLAMVGTGAILVDGIRRIGGERLRNSTAGRLGSMVVRPEPPPAHPPLPLRRRRRVVASQ